VLPWVIVNGENNFYSDCLIAARTAALRVIITGGNKFASGCLIVARTAALRVIVNCGNNLSFAIIYFPLPLMSYAGIQPLK